MIHTPSLKNQAICATLLNTYILYLKHTFVCGKIQSIQHRTGKTSMGDKEERLHFSLPEESEFLCERQLKRLNPVLHESYRSSVFAMDMLLTNYKHIFPFFTNHTFEHSLQVINYCNLLLGPENAEKLNADELYILLMGAGLHDVGMGISEADFREMLPKIPEASAFSSANPEAPLGEVTRRYHQEFSALFIQKYHDLFEIPSEAYVFAISEMARGHRKSDLFDRRAFDPAFRLPSGKTARLPYLAGLIRLSDELDITSDRNLLFDYTNLRERYSEKQSMCFLSHKALKALTVKDGWLTAIYESNDKDVLEELKTIEKKVLSTFDEFKKIVALFPEFKLLHSGIQFEKI